VSETSGGTEPIRVCLAGATGWAGRAMAEAVLAAPDLRLHSAVARSAAGQDLGAAWGSAEVGVTVSGTVEEALAGADVLVDYTSHHAAKEHVLIAVRRGVAVVLGTSGLTGADFEEIDAAARDAGIGVVAAGNFSLTAAMAQAAALLVAPHLPHREIVDYASAAKPDAPSGTARELAERLGEVSRPVLEVPVEQTGGRPEARGATIAGTQVHSVRLPSFVVSTEVVFALPDERLVIRHDAGGTPTPYVAGTLLAVRAAQRHAGLVRGLDTLLLSGDLGD
jgi:4-hydroxy-tetrahydrodipicolinate reductase